MFVCFAPGETEVG